MRASTIQTATPAEEAPVIDTIVLAFAADPVCRWAWPDPHSYLAGMPDFARAFGGAAFRHDGAHRAADFEGAALWLPPDVGPDEEAVGELVERTVATSLRADIYALMGQMGAHHPAEPHWYLPLIGVDPLHQSKGCGTALLKYALEEVDREHLPAYLESTNPRNIPLYQRHGFEILGTIQAGGSPPVVPMLRQRR